MWMQLVTTIVMGVGIGVVAQPQLIVRFMTVKSNKEINRAVLAGGVFILFMTGVAFTVGALSNVYFWNNPKYHTVAIEAVKMDQALKAGKTYTPVVSVELAAKAADDLAKGIKPEAPKAPEVKKETPKPAAAPAVTAPAASTATAAVSGQAAAAAPAPAKPKSSGSITDAIIPLFINEAMPKWFVPIFLVTLLAAAMSTLSSQFHTMGTAIARDVYEKGLQIKNANTVLVNRMGILFTIILSLGVAIFLPRFYATGDAIIAKGTAIFFGLCACSIIPMYVGALYFPRFSKTAGKLGFISGVLVSLGWMLFVHSAESTPLGVCQFIFGKPTLADPKSWVASLDPLIAALPVSIIVSLVTALAGKPMDKEHVKKCFNGIVKL
jgi:SSS family solute:Na+ symporter